MDSASTAGLAEAAPRIVERLEAEKESLIDFITALAEMESPSTDPESQRPVQDVLRQRLEALGFAVEVVPGKATGGHLWARRPDVDPATPYQMLVGHTDTVWPHGTLGTMPVERDDAEGVLRGPGTFDMKAGLSQAIFALEALHALGLEPEIPPAVLFNADEEIGSPESEPHVIGHAQQAARAIVLEPALGEEGLIKTARRGTGGYTIRAVGKSAHAGMDPEKGASAILELSHVVQRLHALSDRERGISVNVGRIEGGTRPNVIAAQATAEVDVRIGRAEDAAWIEEQIETIAATVPGTSLEIVGAVDRPPMERTPRNQALWHAVRACGGLVGVQLEQGLSGGASDGNTTSAYCATIDGMGPVGDGAHAHHEHIRLDDLVPRTAVLALTLLLPATD